MTEYQTISWRDLPSLVVAREGDEVTKSPLPPRFQEAIDEAAMRLGEVDSDAYLAGWQRSVWASTEDAPQVVADREVDRLQQEWTPEAVAAFLDSLGPATDSR